MVVNQIMVKARRVGNSIVLTSPYAEEGRSYYITQTKNGVIVYHPVKTIEEMRESNTKRLNMTLGDFIDSNPEYESPEKGWF